MYREIMLRNKSIFQISTLLCLSSISICNLRIDLPMYKQLILMSFHYILIQLIIHPSISSDTLKYRCYRLCDVNIG
jgi:hypothetical protein